jgi:hypothetical protein
MMFLTTILCLGVRLLQMEDEPRPDLTLNYLLIAVLLVIVIILSAVVGKRRLRERDEEWDL